MTNTETDRTARRTLPAVILVAAMASAALVSLSACNAVSGAGKDLQEASDNVSDAIDDAADD